LAEQLGWAIRGSECRNRISMGRGFQYERLPALVARDALTFWPMSPFGRLCSLIPGFGVKLSAVILAGPTVLSAVAACPPHDGVRRRWWINVASAVSMIESSQKIGRSHHRHRPSRDVFSRRAAGTCDLVIARYAATSFFDQLNSVWLIHMRRRMTASLRARRRLWPFAVHFAWRASSPKPLAPTISARVPMGASSAAMPALRPLG
jgi:hypothetical protein